MSLLPAITPKEFNLLSIGQRGVGKTVFLAGSYTELHSDNQSNSSKQLWFDCQDSQVQENLENLLSYITRTGQYPPSTLKITKFNFSLKSHTLRGQTRSHLGWWEIPGEICNTKNPNFRKMVLSSHGCCVFIDAYALLHNSAYLEALEDITKQVMAIANVVYLNNLKYPFALILTKCDLLEPSASNPQQLKQNLQPLTTRLNSMGVNYQTFYTFIPIVNCEGASTLKTKGASAPLLWLVEELSKTYKPSLVANLLQLVSRPRTVLHQQKPSDGSLQNLLSSIGTKSNVQKTLGLYLFPSTRKYLIFLMGSTVLVGLSIFVLTNYSWVRQSETDNFALLRNIASLQESGQLNQAVALMEKLVQQEPKQLEWRLQLARLYEITGEILKAETAYDQVLAQQKNNIKALIGKAMLRDAQGDTKTAEALFAQAEEAAPIELKNQIRAVSQKTLASP